MVDVALDEVDGITTMWADVPGPLMATLTFRVGQADERLVNRGVTHLCEHLALSSFGVRPYAFNGSTGTTLTSFWVQGQPDEVVEHLNALCEVVSSDRILDRLEHERRVLEVESRNRAPSLTTEHLAMRFGAGGHGLVAWEEFGLHRLGPENVSAWAAAHFVRGNAVLWMSGPPPAGLSLRLADGGRNHVDPPAPLSSRFPAWFRAAGPAAFSALVERSSAAVAATSILGRRCTEQLRHQQGVSYSPWSDYCPLDGERSLVTVGADGPPEHGRVAAWTQWMALVELCDHGPTDRELDDRLAGVIGAEADPRHILGMMSARADALLHRGSGESFEEMRSEVLGVTAEQVARAAARMRTTVLVQLPLQTEAIGWSLREFEPAGAPSAFGAHRRARRRYLDVTNWSSANALVYSSTVVGLDGEGSTHSAELGAETVLVAYGDGTRRVVDRTGRQIVIRPTAWDGGNDVIEWLDATIAPDRVVMVGARAWHPTGSEPAALRRVAGLGPDRHGADPSLLGPIRLDGWVEDEALPVGVPDVRRRLPGAFALGWLAHRQLLAPWVEDSLPDALDLFRRGALLPSALFRAIGDLLTSDVAAPPAALFLADLFVPEVGADRSAYQALLQHLGGAAGPWAFTEEAATWVWSSLDLEWQHRPRRGSEAAAMALSPPVPPLSVRPSRCQPTG